LYATSHEQIAKNWNGLSKLLVLPENADIASMLSGFKKSIKFKFAQPEILLSPSVDAPPPPQKISFPSGAYSEQLQLCNGMMDVESRKREVAVVKKEYAPKKKVKTTATTTASISTAEDNHDDDEEEEYEEEEFPEIEEMETDSQEELASHLERAI
jgi:hypothetical protein